MNKEADKVLTEIDDVLERHGWALIRSGQYRPGGYELWIRPKKQESPPPLGVHVTDGIAGKDKIGG